MASKIDFSSLTAAIPEVVSDFKDLIKTKSFEKGNFADVLNVVEGIEYDKKVGYIGNMPDIGKKANVANCTLNTVTVEIPTSEETWSPKAFDSRMFFCADDLNETIGQKLLNNGIKRYDISESDYFDEVINELARGFNRMWWRFAWMGEINATNVTASPPGDITAGLDVNFLNFQNGFFKRAYDRIGVASDQHITIAANAQSTKATQLSALTADLAIGIANNLYYNAPLEIRQNIINDGMVALCTLSIHDKLKQYFQGKDLESMLTNLENGMQSLKINGIDFVGVPEMDHMIRKYNDLGSTWKDPHRIILAEKNNLLFGVPSIADWGDFEMWYEKKDKGIYIDFEDKYDTRFAFSNQFMFAV